MKIQNSLPIICTLLIAAGCSRNSSTTSNATDEINNPPRVQRDTTNNLAPTSRDTNGASRLYPRDTNNVSGKAPDNTGVNARDRAQDALTAADQGTSESDREITRGIRKAIMAKDDLSTTAKNIKIITQQGKVTLRGPVNSDVEQKAIADMAQTVAGVTSVDNQLEVKTNQ